MTLRDWVIENLPAGAELLDEGAEIGDGKLSLHAIMPGGIWIGCFDGKTTMSSAHQYAVVGSPEWGMLKAALAFAEAIEEKRLG